MTLCVDIKKRFGDFVLQAKFEAGNTVTGILGASGCGKSMTLKCIAGVITPDEGRITLNDTVLFDSEKKINLKPQQRRVGMLFQNYALFPNMTLQQNLMTGLRAYEKDQKKAETAVQKMAERFYLQGLEHHKPSQLSGGQQQRAALARILLSKPQILLLDEPFSALDEFLRWNLELELSEVLKEFEVPTLFVSHNKDEIYRICDQVSVMSGGKCGDVIPTAQLFENPRSKAAAHLSGCKNFSATFLKFPGEVYAADWGITLKTSSAANDDFSGIGVHSHAFRPARAAAVTDTCRPEDADNQGNNERQRNMGTPKYTDNVFMCHIRKVIEDRHTRIILLHPANAQRDVLIRMDVSAEEWQACAAGKHAGDLVQITVSERDIMLLTDI